MVYQLLTFTLINNCCTKYAINDFNTNLSFFQTEEQLFDTLVNEFREEVEPLDNSKCYKFLQFIIDNQYISKNKTCSCGKLFIISKKVEDISLSNERLFQLIDESQICILLDDFEYSSITIQQSSNKLEDDDMQERSTKRRKTALL